MKRRPGDRPETLSFEAQALSHDYRENPTERRVRTVAPPSAKQQALWRKSTIKLVTR